MMVGGGERVRGEPLVEAGLTALAHAVVAHDLEVLAPVVHAVAPGAGHVRLVRVRVVSGRIVQTGSEADTAADLVVDVVGERIVPHLVADGSRRVLALVGGLVLFQPFHVAHADARAVFAHRIGRQSQEPADAYARVHGFLDEFAAVAARRVRGAHAAQRVEPAVHILFGEHYALHAVVDHGVERACGRPQVLFAADHLVDQVEFGHGVAYGRACLIRAVRFRPVGGEQFARVLPCGGLRVETRPCATAFGAGQSAHVGQAVHAGLEIVFAAGRVGASGRLAGLRAHVLGYARRVIADRPVWVEPDEP